MTRVAAVDCGTNSLRLLVADVDPAAGTLTELLRRMEVVRLGRGVDRTCEIHPDALAGSLRVLRCYRADILRLGAERVRMCATSATRDARNRADLVAGVAEVLGVPPQVLTGAEEAALSFAGATREQARGGGVGRPPYLVVDVGGGSCEFVLGSDRVEAAESVDIGCVRLTERHFRDDPPTPSQVDDAIADIDEGLEVVRAAVPVRQAATLLGLAGTVTTVVALVLDLPAYDAARIHHARVSARDVAAVSRRLLSMTHAARAALPVMHPGRVDVIGAGALIVARILDRFGFAELVASEHDILDGIAWSLADATVGRPDGGG